jgi:anti-sigma-K factor RskA
MTDATDHSELRGDDLLAAEYVLGALGADERHAAARRIAREREFAALVAAWETRLIPWTAAIAPVEPPHAVWNKIESALPPQRDDTADWWSSLYFWRWMTAAAGTAALASIVALFLAIKGPAPVPLMASLDSNGRASFVATIDGKHATVAVVPAAYGADATRVPQLWLIGPDAVPRSLGLLDAQRTVVLTIPGNLRAAAADQSVLAVSLEPPGGSPTGLPTGPVIAQGKLTNL